MMNATYNRNLETWEGSDANELRYQIARIGGLKGYPREIVAVRELIRVLAICDDAPHVVRVIDELAESATECPSPARLRALIFEKRTKAKQNRCGSCAGEGFRSVPMLVTYSGGYSVEIQQPMPEMSWGEAAEFAEKLAAVPTNQTVLSCAVECHCRGARV
jgi:hypothetical protein